MAREYVQELTLSLDDVRKMRSAQYAIWEEGFEANSPSLTRLSNRLATSASILSLVFLKSNALGLASGIIGILDNMITSQKNLLGSLVRDGHWHMQIPEDFLNDNRQYDRVRIMLPFMEYPHTDGNIRFVIGRGYITGARYTDGTWETIN